MAETKWGLGVAWKPGDDKIHVVGPHELTLGGDGLWHSTPEDFYKAPGAGWAKHCLPGCAGVDRPELDGPGQLLLLVCDTQQEAQAVGFGLQVGGESARNFEFFQLARAAS